MQSIDEHGMYILCMCKYSLNLHADCVCAKRMYVLFAYVCVIAIAAFAPKHKSGESGVYTMFARAHRNAAAYSYIFSLVVVVVVIIFGCRCRGWWWCWCFLCRHMYA